MKYLVDTNICIYIMNKKPVSVIQRFKQFDVGDAGISTITISELQYGVVNSTNRKENQQRLEQFLAPLEILLYDEMAAEAYGDIRFQLEKKGQLVGPLDVLIAALALSRNLILVTNNDREFKRIKNLRVENWAT